MGWDWGSVRFLRCRLGERGLSAWMLDRDGQRLDFADVVRDSTLLTQF